MMRYLLSIISLTIIYWLAGCSDPHEAAVSVDPTMNYDAVEEAKKTADSSISRDGDWTIVSRVEKDDRVYWFVAPDIDKVSPALFKKTIHFDGKNSKQTLTVSKCEAPRQTCDNLMEQFKALSERYK